MTKKLTIIIMAFLACRSPISAQEKPLLSYFTLQDVTLLQSPFKHAEDLNKKYLLELNADRLLAPFLREAGLTPKAQSYTNWENTGLDGHIGGHYLSGLSLMYASSGDTAIKNRLDYMISELKRCQDANGNGYIGGVPGGKKTWDEIASGNIKAGSFDLNGKWVPLYNIHKTYAGLRDAYLLAGNLTAKEMLIKMADWAVQLVSRLSDAQMQDMLRSEHGGLNETFADVAAITGNEKYLRLAHRFSHNLILDPLLHHEDKLTGMHANTQIPKVLGFKRISEVEGNASWEDAARFFWETVVQQRSVSIGGNSISEHFNPVNDFSRMVTSIEGPETCNTYNMLRLSKMLYQTSRDKKYIDYYERALYNHILSTQHPETGGLVYFTQMRPGHYRVYSQPQTSMWCCVGSGLESHSKYGEMIYAHTDHELYVNLFIPSELNWKEKKVRVVQENHFPDEAKTMLTMHPRKATVFTLQLRCPEWVASGALKISINGKIYPAQNKEGYVAVKRKWKKGDVVVMEIPMQLHVEQLPDHSNYYTFLYGPVVLAAKTTEADQQGLFADDSRGGHIAGGKQIPLKDMPIVVGNENSLPALLTPVKDKPLTFQLNSLFPGKYAAGMELIPFFRLHGSRYIIYWPQATTDGVKEIQKKIEAEEQERIKLDGITIDKMVCGEQQPESDHFIQQQDAWTGFTEDVHWREGRGWFSYRMKTAGAAQLYIKYFDNDKNRSFDVLINDKKLATIQLNGGKGSTVQTYIVDIPSTLLSAETVEIRINAHGGLMTGKITEVRLLRK